VLVPQGGWQAADLLGRERRDGVVHPDTSIGEAHQAGLRQLGQVERLAEREPSAGGGHEPEEVGHRPGPQHGGPVAADVGVIGGVAGSFEMVGPEQGGHQRPAPHRGPCGARSAREWRGFHRDGRTSMSVHKCQSFAGWLPSRGVSWRWLYLGRHSSLCSL